MNLKFHSSENGFCRVYYTSESHNLYAFQDEGSWGRVRFELYRCTRDGEPSYPVSWDGVTLDKMPDDDDCAVARDFAAWFPTRCGWEDRPQ